MSGPIVDAEVALARCVEAMCETLQAASDDALPQTAGTVDVMGMGEVVVDTIAQHMEWELGVEKQRITQLIGELNGHFAALERALSTLPDIPVEVIDPEIERLNAEGSSLAHAIVSVYDEAESLAAELEHEIASQLVPFI